MTREYFDNSPVDRVAQNFLRKWAPLGLRHSVCVQIVFPLRHVLKVFQSIIGFDAVFMVDRLSFRRTDKSGGYHAVDIAYGLARAFTEKDLKVSIRIQDRFSVAGFNALVANLAAHITCVADLVETVTYRIFPLLHAEHYNIQLALNVSANGRGI